jgi:hypothetical protein
LEGDPARLQDAERRLNRHIHHCGCELGAMAVLIVMLISGWRAVSGILLHHAPTWGAVARFIAIAIFAGVVGKLIGIIAGELLFLRAIRDLISSEAQGILAQDGSGRSFASKLERNR